MSDLFGVLDRDDGVCVLLRLVVHSVDRAMACGVWRNVFGDVSITIGFRRVSDQHHSRSLRRSGSPSMPTALAFGGGDAHAGFLLQEWFDVDPF